MSETPTKYLLDMNDFERLDRHLSNHGSDVDTMKLMSAYIDLLRIVERPTIINAALTCLRDIIAERCGVVSEIVQDSCEEFVAEEGRDEALATAIAVFGKRPSHD